MRSDNIPDWAIKGPEDLEYRRYLMLSHVSKIDKKLESGKLWESLQDTDDMLDFLYMQDAEQATMSELMSLKLMDVGVNNLDFMYGEGFETVSGQIMETLIDEAITRYEDLHSKIREKWRLINKSMVIAQSGNKPYLVGDGFVFVITPNNKLYKYSFSNPRLNYRMDWKAFRLTYESTSKYTKEKTLEYISTIKDENIDNIIYRVELTGETVMNESVINVISSNIFLQLRKDYGF